MPALIKRILYTTDLSRQSPYPLKRVLALARATGAEVRILHVCEPLSSDARTTLNLFMSDPTARENALSRRVNEQRKALAERLQAFWGALSDDERAIQTKVVAAEVIEGHASDTILREARKHNCDLIAMGAHQRGEASVFIGDVAKRVQRRSEMMTLIIPYRFET